MSLFAELSKISAQIHTQRHLMQHNEDATILVSIQPFIRALGYDTQNLTEVFPQYNADAKSTGGEKVDYAILHNGMPIVFIEAKAANISLNESNWKQLYNYFNAEVGLRFGILTNGIKYRFYTDLQVRNIMDKEPFLVIDMLRPDKGLVNELEGFTKTGFDPERIINGARKRQIMRLLSEEIERPSDALIRHFAVQVHSGRMSASDIERYGRLLKEAWRGLIAKLSFNQIQLNSNQKEHESVEAIDSSEQETSEIEIPVFGVYKGVRLEATLLYIPLQNWGMMRFGGKVMSASNAIRAAKHTVSPDAKLGWHTTWRWWKLRDPLDDSVREIKDLQTDEDLRQRFLLS